MASKLTHDEIVERVAVEQKVLNEQRTRHIEQTVQHFDHSILHTIMYANEFPVTYTVILQSEEEFIAWEMLRTMYIKAWGLKCVMYSEIELTGGGTSIFIDHRGAIKGGCNSRRKGVFTLNA